MSRSVFLPRGAATILAAAALLLAAGCAPPGPTGYRSLTGQYGHTAERAGEGAWQVVFYANPETARDRLEAYVLYRAAEIARSEGKPRFAVMEHGFQTLEERPTIRDEPPPGFEEGGAGFERGDTTLAREYESPASRDPRVRLKADMLIRPYDGAPPAGAERLYETAQVLRQLGPVIRSAPQ